MTTAEIDEIILANPELLTRIKQLAWWSVQHATKIVCNNPGQSINKQEIDKYIESEIE